MLLICFLSLSSKLTLLLLCGAGTGISFSMVCRLPAGWLPLDAANERYWRVTRRSGEGERLPSGLRSYSQCDSSREQLHQWLLAPFSTAPSAVPCLLRSSGTLGLVPLGPVTVLAPVTMLPQRSEYQPCGIPTPPRMMQVSVMCAPQCLGSWLVAPWLVAVLHFINI